MNEKSHGPLKVIFDKAGTQKAIADETGFTTSTIHRWIKWGFDSKVYAFITSSPDEPSIPKIISNMCKKNGFKVSVKQILAASTQTKKEWYGE